MGKKKRVKEPIGEAEVAFARYMNLCNIRWEYEAYGFPISYVRENGTWCDGAIYPDFFLTDMNLFIEIKNSNQGKWDFRYRLRAFRRQHPWIELKVLTKADLRRMGIL